MTTTCPNCSHPVRTGAKFCGFCGIDLESFTAPVTSTDSLQDEPSTTPKGKKQKKVKTSRRDPWRMIAIIGIILLVLVIVSALFIQYWGMILPLLVQFVSGFTN